MGASKERILVTGAVGQIGSELTMELRRIYGGDNVIASSRRSRPQGELKDSGPFELLDVVDAEALADTVKRHGITTVYHMAAILSGVGEQKPQLCWRTNVDGLYNLLEVAREQKLRLFCPSSIAVFGPETPRVNTPQDTILKPTSMYGVTKVAGERLCDYYVHKYGVDVRGVRYPGIISSETPPGGGTTDYAVAIYYEAVQHGRYTCFVGPQTVLPMMYMPDAIKGTIQLMNAPFDKLVHHSDFNLAAMSFSAAELAEAIAKHVPGFECSYEPDFRQAIADSWPQSIDDGEARKQWDWKPDWDLERMTVDMLAKLRARFGKAAELTGDTTASSLV